MKPIIRKEPMLAKGYKQIGAWYLYDNQLDFQFLICGRRRKKTDIRMVDGKLDIVELDELDDEMPWDIRRALEEVFNLDRDIPKWQWEQLAIGVMEKACNSCGHVLIDVAWPLVYKHTGDTHLENYKSYELWWDVRNGDLSEFDIAWNWIVDGDHKHRSTSLSSIRLHEWQVEAA
jgi:hypothetical protein